MFGNITADTTRSRTVSLLAILAIVGSVTAIALSGGAAAAEPLNDSVEVGNDTGSVYVEATFADSIDDANATADVTIADPNGSEFATGTISGNASETVVEEWNVSDGDPTGNFSVVVTADSGIISETDLGTFSAVDGGGGGGSGGDSSDGWGSVMGFPVWIVVIVVAAGALLAIRVGWHEELI